ncbi:hypothetical protein KS18_01390 [Photorhabdus luminescens]|nr:hypothetical protein KS18_01390 [Photorhabdus luminescens]
MNILINTVNFIMISLFLVSMFLLLSLFVFYGTNKKSFIEIRDEHIQSGFIIPQIIYVISFFGFYGSYYLSYFLYQIITRRKTITSRAFIGNSIPQAAYEFAKNIPKKLASIMIIYYYLFSASIFLFILSCLLLLLYKYLTNT